MVWEIKVLEGITTKMAAVAVQSIAMDNTNGTFSPLNRYYVYIHMFRYDQT